MIQLKRDRCNKAEPATKPAPGVRPYGGVDAEHRAFCDWHRSLGSQLPMMDIDVLLVEFDMCKPVGILELKSSYWLPNLSGACLRTLRALGNMANLPTFCVRCSRDHQSFEVYPLNRLATSIISKPTTMTRNGTYEQFLRELRVKARSRR
ncbi:MAG: hypothetical protein ACYC1M_04055 [Armatimonadota bacterium]